MEQTCYAFMSLTGFFIIKWSYASYERNTKILTIMENDVVDTTDEDSPPPLTENALLLISDEAFVSNKIIDPTTKVELINAYPLAERRVSIYHEDKKGKANWIESGSTEAKSLTFPFSNRLFVCDYVQVHGYTFDRHFLTQHGRNLLNSKIILDNCNIEHVPLEYAEQLSKFEQQYRFKNATMTTSWENRMKIIDHGNLSIYLASQSCENDLKVSYWGTEVKEMTVLGKVKEIGEGKDRKKTLVPAKYENQFWYFVAFKKLNKSEVFSQMKRNERFLKYLKNSFGGLFLVVGLSLLADSLLGGKGMSFVLKTDN